MEPLEKLSKDSYQRELRKVMDSTKLKTYLRCPRLYFYEYLLHWRPERKSHHLAFGSAIHKALEVYKKLGYSEQTKRVATYRFSETYLSELGGTEPPLTGKTDLNGQLLIQAYADRWKEEEEDKIVHIETSGLVPSLEETFLYYKMDTILQDKRGKYYSREHKTTGSNMDIVRLASKFAYDPQVIIYLHSLMFLYGAENVEKIQMDMLKVAGSNGKPRLDFYRHPIFISLPTLSLFIQDLTEWQRSCIEDTRKLLADIESGNAIEKDYQNPFRQNLTSCDDYFGCPHKGHCHLDVNTCRLYNEEHIPAGFALDIWDPREKEKGESK